MQRNKILSLLVLVIVVLTASGCTINLGFGGTPSGPDGGIFKTTNNGDTWVAKSLIPTTSGKPNSISDLDNSLIVLDPSDPKALYFGTIENGIFYSYDAGETWLPIKSLGPITPSAFAVDSIAKCSLYTAIANKVLKSTDCGRSWQQVYYDNSVDITIPSIAVDHYDSHNVFIGTSRGEIITSNDYGQSWRTLQRFDNPVLKILIAPNDSRVIMVATRDKGLYRSTDKGLTWVSLQDNLKEFPDSAHFRDLVFSKAQPGFIIFATNYGLLKSINNGDDWTAIKLITPEKNATINSVVLSAHDTREIYYITDTTFYRTVDGGINWSTKKLPSTRAGLTIIDDPTTDGVIYLGLKKIQQ